MSDLDTAAASPRAYDSTGSRAGGVRGERIDIGGRRLRIVRDGPPGGSPLIVLEHGAFGSATDWAEVQERLARAGLRSLAYDRAGLGHSDPGPTPRDGAALADDLEAVLARAGERGPYVLVGHSMGGLMVRVFALRHLPDVVGVVLVDAVTPDVWDMKRVPAVLRAYGQAMRGVAAAARVGLMRPVAMVFGNLIGLTGEAAVEKRRIYGSPTHSRWAAEEVARWAEISGLAGRADWPPELPVAVVTAGADMERNALKRIQEAPAKASRHGYIQHVAGSNHASLLGARFADPIVRGVQHVLAARGEA